RVRGRQHHRRLALRAHRPAHQGDGRRPVSSLPLTGPLRRVGAARAGRLGPLGVTCAAVIVVLAAVAVLAPLIAPHDPNALDLLHTFASPSPEHPLGTDDTGRDLLSRLIIGSRTSLLGALLVVMLSVSLAVP